MPIILSDEDLIHCAHPITSRPRARRIRNGSDQWRTQCLDCGEPTSQSVKRHIAWADGEPEPFDEEMLAEKRRRVDEYYERVYQLGVAGRRRRDAVWWARYNAYLQSPEWRAKRDAVFDRELGVCQSCRKHAATQVHHLTYDHVFHEPLFDLAAVCDECHDRLHPVEKC